MENNGIVEWDERYSVGIKTIDDQHRELFRLINNFYLACFHDDENAETNFKMLFHGLINYIKYHFTAEEQLLERIKYPDITAHRRQHREFTRDIIETAESFERGTAFSLKNFARYIRDWMLIHVTLIDKKYTSYIHFVNSQGAGRRVHETLAAGTYGKWSAAPEEVPSEIFLG
jgi:hemerythrin-like metal-binding protein